MAAADPRGRVAADEQGPIVPELGPLALSAVDRSHVSALHYKMRDKPYQANQTVGVLAKMFSLADTSRGLALEV